MNSIRNRFKLALIVQSVTLFAFINPISSYKQEKSWTYDLKSFKTSSSNEDMISLDFRIERVSRGVLSMTGTITINYDIVEGDANEIEISTYRSANGIDDFKVLPFNIPRQHMFSFFNSFYKDMAMDSIKDCSDMPQFEEEFKPPFEKKTYTFTKCQISQDGYPQYMQDGFYKVLIAGYGDVEWALAVFCEIQQKM